MKEGKMVSVWRLQPMRDAKVIDLTEIPLYYHDETNNGSSACAITEDALLRVEKGKGWKIPFADITSVEKIRDKKVIVIQSSTKSGEQLPCFFYPSEGDVLFLNEIRSRLKN